MLSIECRAVRTPPLSLPPECTVQGRSIGERERGIEGEKERGRDGERERIRKGEK
jgi:hypothetical protein